jgi:hypothetical protein
LTGFFTVDDHGATSGNGSYVDRKDFGSILLDFFVDKSLLLLLVVVVAPPRTFFFLLRLPVVVVDS